MDDAHTGLALMQAIFDEMHPELPATADAFIDREFEFAKAHHERKASIYGDLDATLDVFETAFRIAMRIELALVGEHNWSRFRGLITFDALAHAYDRINIPHEHVSMERSGFDEGYEDEEAAWRSIIPTLLHALAREIIGKPEEAEFIQRNPEAFFRIVHERVWQGVVTDIGGYDTVDDGQVRSLVHDAVYDLFDIRDSDAMEERVERIADIQDLPIGEDTRAGRLVHDDEFGYGNETDLQLGRLACAFADRAGARGHDPDATYDAMLRALRASLMGARLGRPHFDDLPEIAAILKEFEGGQATVDDADRIALAVTPYALALHLIRGREDLDDVEFEDFDAEAIGMTIAIAFTGDDAVTLTGPTLASLMEDEIVDILHPRPVDEDGDDDDGAGYRLATHEEMIRDAHRAWLQTIDARSVEQTLAAGDIVRNVPTEPTDAVDVLGWIVLHRNDAKTTRRLHAEFASLGADAEQPEAIEGGTSWKAQDAPRQYGRIVSDARRLSKASGGRAVVIFIDDGQVVALSDEGPSTTHVLLSSFIGRGPEFEGEYGTMRINFA